MDLDKEIERILDESYEVIKEKNIIQKTHDFLIQVENEQIKREEEALKILTERELMLLAQLVLIILTLGGDVKITNIGKKYLFRHKSVNSLK